MFENVGFSFPDIPVVEIVVLWMLSFSLQSCLPGDSAVRDIVWQSRLSFPKCSPPFLEPAGLRKGGWKNITVSAPNLRIYFHRGDFPRM